MPSDRLYYLDSCLREFSAEVVDCRTVDDLFEVVLDRTAFHPEGGGQPTDRGTLGDLPVLAVVERDGEVVHRTPAPLAPGRVVVGRIDWDRRLDLSQQHSGQHLLSQAFERVMGAKTTSFHMGEDLSTIELDAPSVSQEQLESVEELSNRVVMESRPILVHMVDASELSRFELRKGTDRAGQVRVVEIQDFDAIPCGGTHCRSTVEIGLVKVTRAERRGRGTRVEFLCGRRALRDYQAKNLAMAAMASTLKVAIAGVQEAVERLLQENADARRQIGALRNRLLDYQAEELARQAEKVDGLSVVAALLPGASPDELKALATRLTAKDGVVALLASAGGRSHVVFARSDNICLDSADLLRRAAGPFGGRGGGAARMAQGGLPEGDRAGLVLDAALGELRSLLSRRPALPQHDVDM